MVRAVFTRSVEVREVETSSRERAELRASLFRRPEPRVSEPAPTAPGTRVARAVAVTVPGVSVLPLAKNEPPQIRVATPVFVAPVSPAPREPEPMRPARTTPDRLPPGGADLALQPTTFTPYDRYLGTVRATIANLEPHASTAASVCHLMKEGHNFKYRTTDPYRADLPAVTARQHAGDCKSKSLWLFENLGDTGALFVIGKAQKRSRTSHAWVYWRNDDRWWILDCTERSDPIAAASVSSDRYVPYYSFGRGGAYRHKATRMILLGANAEETAPVATTRTLARGRGGKSE